MTTPYKGSGLLHLCAFAATVEAHFEQCISYYKRTFNGGLRVNGQDAFTLTLKTDAYTLK